MCSLLIGCGVIRKSIDTSSSSTDSTAVTVQNTDISKEESKHTDKQINTVITERVDTSITVPGTTAIVAQSLNTLIEMGTIQAQDGATSVTLTYDPITGTVRAIGQTDARTIPVQSVKTTEISEDVKTDESASSQDNTKTTERTEVQHEESQKHKEVKSNTVPGGMFLTLIIVISIILVLLYLEGKFFR
jgi:cobalamin biosynthesis Mg chelatase CobN